MGAGIAKTISSRWPGIMGPYRDACRNGGLELGGMQRYEDPDGTVIYNLASQDQPGPARAERQARCGPGLSGWCAR